MKYKIDDNGDYIKDDNGDYLIDSSTSTVQPQAQAQASTESPAEPSAWDQIVSGVTRGVKTPLQPLRQLTAIVPAAVGGGAAFLGSMAGQRESSAPYLEQLKQAGQEGWQAANEDYSKGYTGKGIAGTIADPVALASMAVAPEYGIAKTGLFNAAMGGASEAGRQQAQNPNADLDYKKIGLSAATGGALGSGLRAAGKGIANYAANKAATELENADIAAKNAMAEASNTADLQKMQDVYNKPSIRIPSGAKNINFENAMAERIENIRNVMKNYMNIPQKSKISDAEVMNWYEDLGNKIKANAEPIETLKETPSILPNFIKSNLLHMAEGAGLGSLVGGGHGAVIGGLAPLALSPIDKALKAIPASAYSQAADLGKGLLPGIQLANSAATSKLYDKLDQLMGKKKP